MRHKPLTMAVPLTTTYLSMNAQQQHDAGQYAEVNGLKMYYEVHGSGRPLVLLHGGGSTIESNYGRILPELARSRKVIAIELQAHGHTADRDNPLSFEQDADDVAELLKQLHVDKADIMGFSNGGTTSLQIAIRYPHLVNKLVLASTTYKRDGMQEGFFEGMQHATIDQMPPPLKDAYFAAKNDYEGFNAMFYRDVARMQNFKDISDDKIHAIQAHTLVINANAEVVRFEHAMQLAHTLPHAQLAILPGGHGDYIGEICAPDKDSKIPALVVGMIDEFLGK